VRLRWRRLPRALGFGAARHREGGDEVPQSSAEAKQPLGFGAVAATDNNHG